MEVVELGVVVVFVFEVLEVEAEGVFVVLGALDDDVWFFV